MSRIIIIVIFIFSLFILLSQEIIPCETHTTLSGTCGGENWGETKVSILDITSSKQLTFFSCKEEQYLICD